MQSAKKLEDQINRIDHFLGKETVQNIMVFRFVNVLFAPLWNRNCIDRVQITVAEKDGVGHRGDYYEGAGALRTDDGRKSHHGPAIDGDREAVAASEENES